MLTTLYFGGYAQSLEKLKIYSEKTDKSQQAYTTDRAHMFWFGQDYAIKDESMKNDQAEMDKMRVKHMKSLFDDYDYLTDNDR